MDELDGREQISTDRKGNRQKNISPTQLPKMILRRMDCSEVNCSWSRMKAGRRLAVTVLGKAALN